jgi:hypothetical protein
VSSGSLCEMLTGNVCVYKGGSGKPTVSRLSGLANSRPLSTVPPRSSRCGGMESVACMCNSWVLVLGRSGRVGRTATQLIGPARRDEEIDDAVDQVHGRKEHGKLPVEVVNCDERDSESCQGGARHGCYKG